jgi:hypothetical protein
VVVRHITGLNHGSITVNLAERRRQPKNGRLAGPGRRFCRGPKGKGCGTRCDLFAGGEKALVGVLGGVERRLLAAGAASYSTLYAAMQLSGSPICWAKVRVLLRRILGIEVRQDNVFVTCGIRFPIRRVCTFVSDFE